MRSKLLSIASSRSSISLDSKHFKVSSIFATYVFDLPKMKNYVAQNAFQTYAKCVKEKQKIDSDTAAHIAHGMKTWAMEHGVKSYTHWFQPLTGATAEKHDSFFELNEDGLAIENFSASSLIQQEPDASSFPNGGIRQTFEARGYTAWDISSPAFIMVSENHATLCIPTIFISYTGETLDFKAPLLKSINALENAVLPVAQLFDKNITEIYPTLGWEQEYFLVDEALYYSRVDLLQTGRTLFGVAPAKGQQLEDHYFGSIPERVLDFMTDLECEAHMLGIPLRTRHNEVAPNQFECAPMFEAVNIAVDHNQLLMDLMHKVAKKHKFKVLLHEKPFKGVNGSGKHNNWSLSTNTGKNLLAPGKTPKNNLLFLTTIVNVVAAVAQYSDLIRVAIASAGNDHRLGASEAPPAIISVFLGKAISNIFDEIANTELENDDQIISDSIRLSIHNSIPEIMLDNTDRNRTSPFAFTGNKFEIRAVGSSANCSFVMSVMNTIVAKQFSSFYHQVNDLIKSGIKKEIAILQTIKELIKTSEFIRFEGDNYSKEWEEEAARRGLSNRKNTPDALDFLIEPRNIDAFVSQKVYTEKEIHARYEILNHQYTLTIQIEARILGDIAVNSVIPSALKYLNVLLDNITKSKALFDDVSLYQGQMELAKTISTHINDIKFNVDEMIESRKKCNSETHIPKQTKMYYELVFPYLERIRYHIDKLELLTDNSLWPMAKYRELMFIK